MVFIPCSSDPLPPALTGSLPTSALYSDVYGSQLSMSAGTIGELSVKNVPYVWPLANAVGVLTNAAGTGVLTWTPAVGSGAPVDAGYVVVNATNASLTSDRRLTVDSTLSMVVGAADSVVTISAVNGIGIRSVRTLSTDTGRVSLTVAHENALGFPLAANTLYHGEAYIIYRTQAATTGPRLTALISTEPSTIAGEWLVGGFGADAAAGAWFSAQTSGGNSVESSTPTGVLRADENYLAQGNLVFLTGGAASNVTIAFGTEVNASRVTLKAGSVFYLTRLS